MTTSRSCARRATLAAFRRWKFASVASTSLTRESRAFPRPAAARSCWQRHSPVWPSSRAHFSATGLAQSVIAHPPASTCPPRLARRLAWRPFAAARARPPAAQGRPLRTSTRFDGCQRCPDRPPSGSPTSTTPIAAPPSPPPTSPRHRSVPVHRPPPPSSPSSPRPPSRAPIATSTTPPNPLHLPRAPSSSSFPFSSSSLSLLIHSTSLSVSPTHSTHLHLHSLHPSHFHPAPLLLIPSPLILFSRPLHPVVGGEGSGKRNHETPVTRPHRETRGRVEIRGLGRPRPDRRRSIS